MLRLLIFYQIGNCKYSDSFNTTLLITTGKLNNATGISWYDKYFTSKIFIS